MSIQDQIAEAEAAAANTPDVPTVQTGNQSLAPAAQTAPVDMGITGFLKAGGLQPDLWLDVKEAGLKLIKSEKKTIDEFKASIDFSSVKLFVGLRVKLSGSDFEYIKSYDGRTESKTGKPWATAVQEANARAIEPSEQYRGADILFTLTEDVKQGDQVIEAGKKIGYTTAVTGFGLFQAFLGEMITAGKVQVGEQDALTGVVNVKATHVEKSNAKFNWAIVGFEAI